MSKDGRPILLSLDGGGAKGWSQIPLISGLVSRIKKAEIAREEKITEESYASRKELKEENIYPCEYFDLIVGSGTGGINAIMMGRLGMSIAQCKKAWEELAEVFKVDTEDESGEKREGGPLFSAKKMEAWARKLVRENTAGENEGTMMLIKPDDKAALNKNGKSCRVGITSMRAQNIGQPAIFRSYRVRANAGVDCAIWEVLRATTAAPLLFESVFIGRKWAKQEFINAELGANNPISYVFQEKEKIWLRKDNWPPPEIGCVLSIGSGKDSVISLDSGSNAQAPGGVVTWARSFFTGEVDENLKEDLSEKLYRVMLRIAKDCERKHQEIEASYGENDEKVYFRFNVEQGMQDVPETSYNEENWDIIETSVDAYTNHAEHEELVEPFLERMLMLLGIEQPDEQPCGADVMDTDEAAPAYEPSTDPRIVEKAKGVAMRLGATSG
ncbi:hypothetical protein M408DRAFT_330721 [Serendipita vermifera MAFF 305830]|uniref:PNPLA domain-containing protein n=1 Tax=Serendipita vermifera MAFF 305830 TaxID=933852 RepID=A0A0C3ANK1_SERVB|nr:hypothetical protein M408DRAFT_330721 [Serendipita vermifera MAFF 305830]